MEADNEIDFKKRLRPRTYSITVYMVVLFLLIEVLALGFIFYFRQRVRIETDGPTLVDTRKAMEQSEIEFLQNLPNLPPPDVAARIPVPGDETIQEKVLRYNEDSRNFRKQGDFGLAEAALNKALELKPEDSMTLISMAMLQEAENDKVRALATWKHVLTILPPGDSTLARAKERTKLLEEGLRLENEARIREDQMIKSGQRRVFIETVKTTPNPVPAQVSEVQTEFMLRLPESPARFDASKLRIQVFVYDRTGEGKLEPAKIEAKFLSAQPDWKQGGTETLRTTYFRPLDAKDGRAYYGYLIRIYYGDELQDQRAEPRELLDLVSGKNS